MCLQTVFLQYSKSGKYDNFELDVSDGIHGTLSLFYWEQDLTDH